MIPPMRIVFLGLSVTSSWGNGHATNYRGLLRALRARGHHVLFLERDVPWYAAERDLPAPSFAQTALYQSLEELRRRFSAHLLGADAVVIGSYVPDGAAVAEWALETTPAPVLFYDMDTPVTLAALERGDCKYLTPDLIRRFDAYLSFAGGPALRLLEKKYGAARAVGFYCLVDPARYSPNRAAEIRDDLGYLGTYSDDRQPVLGRLLLQPARVCPLSRFVVAGPQYPATIDWPSNVRRIEHVPPGEHRAFYCSQRFTLNVTRLEMTRLGYAPSVRLFEAAACGTPIISDRWDGIDEFFAPGEEILLADSAEDVVRILHSTSERARRRIAAAARRRVLREHTADHRAAQLEEILLSCTPRTTARLTTGAPT
ncbi:MAG TPA: glycosyltransferase [Phycisphaerales bacterium]|nr:glycosyltransferase [Phycisphaerales bacterium]